MKPGERVPVSDVRVSVFGVPTDSPESDATYAWDTTTLVHGRRTVHLDTARINKNDKVERVWTYANNFEILRDLGYR